MSAKAVYLLTERALNKLTAIMIGEIGSNSIEWSDLDRWFPFDFLLFLGLATGIETGAPWVEFRDAEGKLVRRIHSSLGHPLFSKGHAAIGEEIHGSIGYLLTKAQSSPGYNRSYLHVAIKNVIRGGSYSLSLEDKLRHLFLVFDNLCDEYKIRRQLSVSEKNKPTVNAAIKQANKTISELAKQAKVEGDIAETKVLQRIAQGISSATIVYTGFGENVIALINNFGFPDAEILLDFYQANPRPDGRKWRDVLSYYRGIIMHRGYFSFRESYHDIDDVLRIINHLHDILVRIIFKMLGYNRTYQPTVITMTDSQPIDWVKPDTPANHLGY